MDRPKYDLNKGICYIFRFNINSYKLLLASSWRSMAFLTSTIFSLSDSFVCFLSDGSSSIVVCKLEANTYEHEVTVRLGFELQGNAIIRFLFDGHRIGRFMREGRETLQIYLFGTRPLSRNKYFNFILECRSAECFLNDLTLLAYQAWYDC